MNTSANIRPLQDRTALVTHATTAIGAAIAEALALAGAKVMLNYLEERDKADRLAGQIRANQGQAMIFRADINRRTEVNSMLDVLIAYWGRLDILVNNTGLRDNSSDWLASPGSTAENISLDLADQFLRVRQADRELSERRVNPRPANTAGKILCVSEADIDSKPGLRLRQLLDSLTPRLSGENIRVNGILAETCQADKLIDISAAERKPALSDSISDGHDGNACAIAKLAVWLVSDEADSLDGEILTI